MLWSYIFYFFLSNKSFPINPKWQACLNSNQEVYCIVLPWILKADLINSNTIVNKVHLKQPRFVEHDGLGLKLPLEHPRSIHDQYFNSLSKYRIIRWQSYCWPFSKDKWAIEKHYCHMQYDKERIQTLQTTDVLTYVTMPPPPCMQVNTYYHGRVLDWSSLNFDLF